MSVHEVVVQADDGVRLSGLYASPGGTPRATLVAIHGMRMRAGYFHGRVSPDTSLLTLAPTLGYAVLALDRPGYGLSAGDLPKGQSLAAQSLTMHAALRSFARSHDLGAGYALVAHSYGGMLAVTMAADDAEDALLCLDVAGLGHHYSPEAYGFPDTFGAGASRLNWGPLHLYPPGTFRASRTLMTPLPWTEEHDPDAPWPLRYRHLAPRVRVPVRLTFAEHELWWQTHDAALAQMTGYLTSSPRVETTRAPGAGHNISLGYAARPYHLRALAFVEECVSGRG
ncbi:alpha/beta hydrolase [Streptomyces sp. NPDC001941]|uniref:alpha/beta hydrolase n=1 Tax=Streptomyces sp. NPDC001941 TaxID=3154659 RepID=UPI0033329325